MEQATYSLKEIINLMYEIYLIFQDTFMMMTFSTVNDFFKANLGFFLDIPIVSNVIQWVLDTTGIGNQTVLTFMIAGGLGLYIGIMLIKWFIGIVT